MSNYFPLVALFRHARIHRRSHTICFLNAELFRDCVDESLLAERGTIAIICYHGSGSPAPRSARLDLWRATERGGPGPARLPACGTEVVVKYGELEAKGRMGG